MSCVTWCNYDAPISQDKKDPESQLCVWSVSLATFSNWFRDEVLGVFEGNTPTIPSALYVAIHSTDSTSSTPGTELSGDGYSRTLITFERVSDIQRWNSSDVITSAATAQWPNVASYSIWDSATIGGGNYYAYGNLVTEYSVDSGKAVKFPANKVIVGMGSAIT